MQQVLMEQQIPLSKFNITIGNQSGSCYIDKTKDFHQIIIGRKPKDVKYNEDDIQRIAMPNNLRLTSEHAFITISKKNNQSYVSILRHLFKKLPNEVLQLVLGYLISDMEITIRDLGSKCGTYLPKNRPIGLQQFWLMNQYSQSSFRVFFLSTPESPKLKDSTLIQYILNCGVQSDDDTIIKRVFQCKNTDIKEMATITHLIQANFLVAVLSHKSMGYVFIKKITNNKISIGDQFEGKIVNGRLELSSKFQIYTNICEQKQVARNHKYSDAFRIKSKQCIIIGQERCNLNLEW